MAGARRWNRKGGRPSSLFRFLWTRALLVLMLGMAGLGLFLWAQARAAVIAAAGQRLQARAAWVARAWSRGPRTEAAFEADAAPWRVLAGWALLGGSRETVIAHYAVIGSDGRVLAATLPDLIGQPVLALPPDLLARSPAGWEVAVTPRLRTESVVAWQAVGPGLTAVGSLPVGRLLSAALFSLAWRLALGGAALAAVLAWAEAVLARDLRRGLDWAASPGEPGPAPVPLSDLLGARRRVRQQLDALADAARRDPLTGLFNRGGLEQVLESYFALPQPPPAVFILADLDRFKQLNDTRGHAAGDEALMRVARNLAAGVKAEDVVARLGGDEFVVVLFGIRCNPRVKNRITAVLSRVASLESELGVSAGVVDLPAEAGTFAAAYRLADRRLYAAKGAGRHRWIGPHTGVVEIPTGPPPAL
ncbi:putative Diguanylate cyclase [Candidatus Hydrogenisulfobacillus filiaventi]|uniref:Putative Diguanylate cyclase n=1 Tax=Candidatus Hydrogenisulfobacillus filiaventi TaxID=2707344 RepID=A0A6F8ZD49_9FIRM|nr:GGDEF domain-containing protein [Bacillota bacterium]CAB1127798.1 putative Diguanylate cyclase [Candidatus Hydrogenisulfobacillus filiaventi]